ncbi:MAG: hypothetical protein C0514_01035 [Candidatus Puniceispirillum sp.]|nr:hypothetical protein [Candidatus Puniceispirillum sp.]
MGIVYSILFCLLMLTHGQCARASSPLEDPNASLDWHNQPRGSSPWDYGLDLIRDIPAVSKAEATQLDKWYMALSKIGRRSPDASRKFLNIYHHVQNALSTWDTDACFQSKLLVLQGETLLRMVNNPYISFPVFLGPQWITRLACTHEVIAIGQQCSNHHLTTRGSLALVKQAEGDTVLLNSAPTSKTALLLAVHAQLPDNAYVPKALSLIVLLKIWDSPDFQSDGHVFKRKDYMKLLFQLSCSTRISNKLRQSIFETLEDYWMDTEPFLVDGFLVNKEEKRVVVYDLMENTPPSQNIKVNPDETSLPSATAPLG